MTGQYKIDASQMRTTIEALTAWSCQDDDPSRVIYHVGDLATDRLTQKDVASLADAAYELHRKGKIALVQRRLDQGCWAYGAIRCAKAGGPQR